MTTHSMESGPREEGESADFSPGLHPVVDRAAEGVLPEWARAGEERRGHMARVADVLEGWARALDLESRDVLRWRSLGFLHDALRDAAVEELRSVMKSALEGESEPPGETEIPGEIESPSGTGKGPGWRLDRHAFSLDRADLDDWAPVGGSLHGPAVAVRLAGEGLEDEEILSAVAYHTVGHPDLGAAGRALYCADFVEPGRSSDRELRGELRARYPKDPDGVLRDVLRARIGYLLERGRPIFLGTARMWNRAEIRSAEPTC